MSIPAIAPITLGPPSPPAVLSGPSAVPDGSGAQGFGAQLARGLENLQQVQSSADDLAVKAATGTLTDAHDYLIASTQAALTTQLTVAIRNKAVESFTEIMRMQV